MIPRTLTLSGFLSYRAPITIDFTTFDLACIAGANGAGKSSLLDAITWVIFGRARKTDDTLLNTHPEVKAAQVTLEFEYETNLYRIQRTNPRGKTSVLEFQIAQMVDQLSVPGVSGNRSIDQPLNWKPLTERSLRETQRRIEETLRLDYDTFVNAAFFLQGKADQFTQQRPADRKRILSSILGLETWETYRKTAADRRKLVESDIDTLKGRLDEINAELGEETARKTRLTELENQLTALAGTRTAQEQVVETAKNIAATLAEQRKLVETLHRQLTATQTQRNALETRYADRAAEQATLSQTLSQAPEIQIAYDQWTQARTHLATWDETATRFREHETRRNAPQAEIQKERALLEKEQANLLQQKTQAATRNAQLATLQTEITALQAELATLDAQLAQRAQLEADLQTALHRQAEAKAENPRLRAEMNDLKERIDRLKETEGAACPLCGQPLPAEDRTRLIAELETQGKDKGDQYRANQALLKEADDLVRSLQTQITTLHTLDTTYRAHTNKLAVLSATLAQTLENEKTWQETGLPQLSAVQTQLAEEDYALEARALLAQINADLKEIGYDAAEHDRIRREVADGQSTETALRTLERAQAALEPLQSEIANIQTQITTLENELTHQQTEYDSARTALTAAETAAPDLTQAQRALFKLLEQENILRTEVGMAKQKVAVLDDLRTRRKALDTERETLAQTVARYKQLEKAFGKDGVPALLIEQALPQIEAKANEILDRLSNGEMSVRFQTQKELKTTDALRETLEIQISDRAGTRDYELYSGGEAFRANFAIRLALSEILAQRAGARLQTLVIDEGFGSQDTLGRQRLIEAINMVKADFAKILVITHIDELKEAFPTRIEVEKTDVGSAVRVV
ncbi:MAG: SMC family ATPase [Anaerolineales bacterium]|nr:SMC family ATPase [Anaerolineales bacterium]